MAHPYWPLFDLVVRTPRLELRPIDDGLAMELAGVADLSMFERRESEFLSDWVTVPSPERERRSLQFWWRNRAEFSADQWILNLAVIVDGRAAGVQDVQATAFPLRRQVTTGSWLAQPFQAKGLGTEMRQAVLHFAFDGLGALEAMSAAFDTNRRSIAVSRRAGYEENGRELNLRGGRKLGTKVMFRMTAERFARFRRHDVVIEGLEPCLDLLGLTGSK
jgi:RimJ/RimL family protein N-acetyltransferase